MRFDSQVNNLDRIEHLQALDIPRFVEKRVALVLRRAELIMKKPIAKKIVSLTDEELELLVVHGKDEIVKPADQDISNFISAFQLESGNCPIAASIIHLAYALFSDKPSSANRLFRAFNRQFKKVRSCGEVYFLLNKQMRGVYRGRVVIRIKP